MTDMAFQPDIEDEVRQSLIRSHRRRIRRIRDQALSRHNKINLAIFGGFAVFWIVFGHGV